jgi:hypothetical protein
MALEEFGLITKILVHFLSKGTRSIVRN